MAKIKFRRDTAAAWTDANPTLAQGEPGFEHDTGQFKIGDGETQWSLLEYAAGSIGDIVVDMESEEGSFTRLTVANKDFTLRTTRTASQDADINLEAADDVFITANGDDISLTANGDVRINTNNGDNTWTFEPNGHLTFPDGSVQVTAYTGDADNNIWIETYATANPNDIVQSASSVEYDANGNVFALFSHYESNVNNSYTSIAKLTPAGAVLWQLRLDANLDTDGWGLAYDSNSDNVYIAGRTSGTPLTYQFATLTKINAVDGTVIWSKTYDFEANSSSTVVDVDTDFNPVMVGYADNGTDTYIHTTKVNSADGTVLWSKTVDGQGSDEAYGMAVGPSGEVVAIGYIDTYGVQDAVDNLYVDLAGNPLWTISGSINLDGVTADFTFVDGFPTFTNIVDTVGGRAVDDILGTVLGSTIGGVDGVDDMIVKVATFVAGDTDDRMVVIKYASNGDIAWQKAVQFDENYNCTGADADIDASGNIYVCGQYRYDYNGGTTSAMSLVKFNSAGEKQWSRRVVGNCDTFATSVVVGPDNNLYLSGVTGNDNTGDYTWVIAKYDVGGVVVWQRLIDNMTTWTFGGGFWFGSGGGGSNIAVRNGYVALAGAFGDPGMPHPTATVVQIDTDATPFSVGEWDIKGATFSGTLNNTASDITVVDAGKTAGAVTPGVNDFNPTTDATSFLNITRYGLGTVGTGDITFDGIKIIGNTTDGDLSAGGIKLIPNMAYEGAGQFVKIYPTMGQDAPHIHVAAGPGGDLLIGDDNHYMDVNHTGDIVIKADTDNGSKVRNLVENFQSNNWSGAWASAEWTGTQINFVEISGTVKRWIIKYLDQSRVLGRSLTINNITNLTYDSYQMLINGGFIIYVNETAPSATAVTDLSVGCVLENYLDIDSSLTDINLITRSNWDINISAGYENDVRIDAGDDIIITAGTKIRNDSGGGVITIQSGNGGMADHNDLGGDGGSITIEGGEGGEGSSDYEGGGGANVTVRAGSGGVSNGAGGGAGGTLQLFGGTSHSNNAGGDIYLRPGTSPTSGSGLVSIETVSAASVTNTWQFGNDGSLTLPGGAGFAQGDPGYLKVNDGGTLGLDLRDATGRGFYTNGDGFAIRSNSNNTWQFGTGGSLTLPGAVVNSTVAKTGAILGANDMAFEVTAVDGSGVVTEVTITNTPNTAWQNNGAGTGVTNGDLSFTVQVDGLGNATVSGITSLGGHSIGETFTTSGDGFGAGITITALDLTKSINKLTDGQYTLADGVEGQIMYLVKQTGSIGANSTILVANARVNGTTHTLFPHYPFGGGNDSLTTMIFTDGAWQSSNGSWD